MDKEFEELSDTVIEALNYWVFSFCNAYTPQTKEAIERKNNDIKKAKRAIELLKESGSTTPQSNGDKIRSMSDDELAQMCITSHWDDYSDRGMLYQSTLVEGNYTTFDGAYKANCKWLKREYKGE